MSGDERPELRRYYTQQVPDDMNRLLDEQAALGEAGRSICESMRAVDGTIRIDIVGEAAGSFYLNIAAGRVTAGDAPSHEPFVRVTQDDRAFRQLAREANGSLGALLGALAGLADNMKLTHKRMLDLVAVDGLIRFEVTGEGGFSLLTRFGAGPAPAEPDATIRMDEAVYRDLRAGRLDPQNAFLEDTIHAEGDLQKVMQLAFAAVAPD